MTWLLLDLSRPFNGYRDAHANRAIYRSSSVTGRAISVASLMSEHGNVPAAATRRQSGPDVHPLVLTVLQAVQSKATAELSASFIGVDKLGLELSREHSAAIIFLAAHKGWLKIAGNPANRVAMTPAGNRLLRRK